MKKISFCISLLSTLTSVAQVDFQTIDFKEAMSMAKKQDKPVFLYAYSNWCEPCEAMDDYTLADLEVANYYNNRFVNIRLDMEAYPGAEIAEAYDVTIYPGMLFLDSEGNVIHRGCGSMDSGEFLELGKKTFEQENFSSFQDKYHKGDRDAAFLLRFLEVMEDACLDAEGLAQKVMSEIADKDLLLESSFSLIENHQWDIFSREFQYLIKNRTAFEESLGSSRVNDKIFDTYLSQYQEIYEAEELHVFALRALMNEMNGVDFSGSDTLKMMMSLHYHKIIEDWVSFGNAAISWIEMTTTEDPDELEELAWNFYLFIDDKGKLETALSWAKRSVDANPTPSSIDTYASLYFKLGNVKKAIELEQQAIELAVSLSEETEHLDHQLAKFKND